MRVGYLGPEGTFSHEAVLASPAAARAEHVPLGTNHDVVLAVQDGRVDRAVAPMENLVEGAVNAVLDALALAAPDVVLTGELVLPVRHCLVAGSPLEPAAVEAVLSHPQPLAQCAGWLRAHAPRARAVPASSTAEAARAVVSQGEPWAAIAPRGAADRYGAVVLAEDIADEPGNATRFVWLARREAAGAFPAAGPGAAEKTSVLFHGAGDGSPGWLVRCLSEFAFRGVNLTRIESRPSRQRLGHYAFHVDLDGAVGHAPVDDAVRALRAHCEEVRVLGSYPAA
ncbi:MAG: Prephenate dehydratase [uncultured Solirubrobacteraceae bacterium]|uniref:Prephenate dehydratase n=1 Tax=uncultured Solirubrobacteraceae bacterium TaxID=1162706 RepID=A0A6J4T7L6_9ACTN|nr:MAG: Prephenate dehydratase [uncultured Solirubrobacteraceae bacterium]